MNLSPFLVEIKDKSGAGEGRSPKLLCVCCKDGKTRKLWDQGRKEPWFLKATQEKTGRVIADQWGGGERALPRSWKGPQECVRELAAGGERGRGGWGLWQTAPNSSLLNPHFAPRTRPHGMLCALGLAHPLETTKSRCLEFSMTASILNVRSTGPVDSSSNS